MAPVCSYFALIGVLCRGLRAHDRYCCVCDGPMFIPGAEQRFRGGAIYLVVAVVVVVVVLTLTRIIKSVVTGQAPVTLEMRNIGAWLPTTN